MAKTKRRASRHRGKKKYARRSSSPKRRKHARRGGRRKLSAKQIAAGFGGKRNPPMAGAATLKRAVKASVKKAERAAKRAAKSAAKSAAKAAKRAAPKSAVKKKKKGGWPRFGRRDTKRWAKRRRVGRPTYSTKSGAKRHKPRKGPWTSARLRRGYRMAAPRRRALIAGGFLDRSGRVNPGKKRRKHRRGGKRYSRKHRKHGRRRSHGRRNPGLMIDRIKAFATSPKTYTTVGQILLGMSSATFLPAIGEDVSKGKIANVGGEGVLMAGLASLLSMGLAAYAEAKVSSPLTDGLARNVGIGGLVITGLRAAMIWAPGLFHKLGLPTPMSVQSPFKKSMPAPSKGAAGMGYYNGMGMVNAASANEALIAGESYARHMSQFSGMGDWVELKGMGGMGDWLTLKGMGDNRIPMNSLLSGGYPGQYGAGSYDPYNTRHLGDWVESINDAGMQPLQLVGETF